MGVPTTKIYTLALVYNSGNSATYLTTGEDLLMESLALIGFAGNKDTLLRDKVSLAGSI